MLDFQKIANSRKKSEILEKTTFLCNSTEKSNKKAVLQEIRDKISLKKKEFAKNLQISKEYEALKKNLEISLVKACFF